MVRSIIKIDEEKCTGCGRCIPACPEGAIKIIDGKARLVSELMCDGLGACLGHCPEGAITIEKREVGEYDESRVIANIVKGGPGAIRAHLEHLRQHGQQKYLAEAERYLRENNIPIPQPEANPLNIAYGSCPGSTSFAFADRTNSFEEATDSRPSHLRHWPIQMHLISPQAPHYRNADVLLAADCVAYAMGDFHRDFLKGRALAIACPKLDEGQEIYIEKIRSLIDDAKINTLTVMIMQVPCCGGLLRMAQLAASQAKRKIPIRCIVVGLQGKILSDEWVSETNSL